MLTNAYEIPFTLAAGASLVLPAGSFEFVYLSSISAGASVRLKGSQVSIDLVVGRRVEFGNPTVQPLTLENQGGGSVSGVLLVGSGDVRDSNVVGTVSVTNADKDRSLSGTAFFGLNNRSAGATEYCVVYLANPAGSGVNLFVNKAEASSPSGTGWINFLFADDLVAFEAEVSLTLGPVVAGRSKIIGGAAGAGEVRSAVSSSDPSFIASIFAVSSADFATPGSYLLLLTEPVVVPPGMAFVLVDRTVNQSLRGNFEWFEESV